MRLDQAIALLKGKPGSLERLVTTMCGVPATPQCLSTECAMEPC